MDMKRQQMIGVAMMVASALGGMFFASAALYGSGPAAQALESAAGGFSPLWLLAVCVVIFVAGVSLARSRRA